MTVDPIRLRHTTSELLDEPWYLPVGDEVQMFEAAYQARLPVLLKGPTGCGKTRFVEHMAWRLFRHAESPRRAVETPLITVACHEDLTATDLVGPLPAGRRRDGVDRRAADPGGAQRRAVLPRRGGRGPQGHDGRGPRPDRPPPGAADREDGRAARRPPRLPAPHLLQPRLPEHPEGPEAVDPPALRQPRVRLPRRRRRGHHHRPRGRGRRRPRPSAWPSSARRSATSASTGSRRA